MSMPKYARKIDTSQPDIVKAVSKAGWLVIVAGYPVDLLCWKNGQVRLLECKTLYGKRNPKARIDKRQKEQIEFLAATSTPVVCTPEEALRALGEIA